MNRRRKKFLKEMTPLIEKLNSFWFPSDKLSPDGLHYACYFCDQHCGNFSQGHDEACLADRAKRVLIAFDGIHQNEGLRVDYKGNPRDPESIKMLMDSFKVDSILEIMFNKVHLFEPLDYNDPVNNGTVCPCFLELTEDVRDHSPHCVHISLAKALGKLIKP